MRFLILLCVLVLYAFMCESACEIDSLDDLCNAKGMGYFSLSANCTLYSLAGEDVRNDCTEYVIDGDR